MFIARAFRFHWKLPQVSAWPRKPLGIKRYFFNGGAKVG
jgi:hypothetical protein